MKSYNEETQAFMKKNCANCIYVHNEEGEKLQCDSYISPDYIEGMLQCCDKQGVCDLREDYLQCPSCRSLGIDIKSDVGGFCTRCETLFSFEELYRD